MPVLQSSERAAHPLGAGLLLEGLEVGMLRGEQSALKGTVLTAHAAQIVIDCQVAATLDAKRLLAALAHVRL